MPVPAQFGDSDVYDIQVREVGEDGPGGASNTATPTFNRPKPEAPYGLSVTTTTSATVENVKAAVKVVLDPDNACDNLTVEVPADILAAVAATPSRPPRVT